MAALRVPLILDGSTLTLLIFGNPVAHDHREHGGILGGHQLQIGEVLFVAGRFLATALGHVVGIIDRIARVIQLLELTVVAEVVLLLVSAFRKMLLYEAAYGYTVSRLWGQGIMVVLAISLGALALELRHSFDVNRLARRSALAAAAMLLVFTYWNHEAWITRRNLDRFAENGRYDVSYVAYQLSSSAVPAGLEAARAMGGARGACMDRLLRERWSERVNANRAWFELNLAERRAREALSSAPLVQSTRIETHGDQPLPKACGVAEARSEQPTEGGA